MRYEDFMEKQERMRRERENKTKEEKEKITLKMKRDIEQAFTIGKVKVIGDKKWYYET